jgi:hypothetical protein
MTRPWLRPNDKGIYICEALEDQIEARMQPRKAKRPGRVTQWLWGCGTFLTSIGMVFGYLFGLVFILPVAAVFRRVRR